MLQSDVGSPSLPAPQVADSKPHGPAEGMMSSFTIKTAKPWTVVNPDGRAVREKSASVCAPYARPSVAPGKELAPPRETKWVNLTTDHAAQLRTAPPGRRRSPSTRSHSLCGDGSRAPRKQKITFHCLEFNNGVLRAADRARSSSSNDSSPLKPTFIASEYQQRLQPARPHKEAALQPGQGRFRTVFHDSSHCFAPTPPPSALSRPPSADSVPAAGPADNLEAAHILLDFTRSAR